jgi:SAM-dependent methyltransferase
MICSAKNAQCDFGTLPRIALDTGNHLVPQVEIWQCRVCGHGVTRPAMIDVSPLYEERGSEDFIARDTGWVQSIKRFAFARLARKLLAEIGNTPKTIVDFGTGNGMLASALAETAPDSETYALDFFETPPALIGNAHYRAFDASAELIGATDFLACFHVLEHDDDSDAMLEKLIGYLRPGGMLVIEVPNVDCVWTPWFGRACANWYAPFHRVHFSRQSLRALFERHGLKIRSEHDICGPTFALSLAALFRVKPNSALFAISVALRPIQWLAEKITRRPSALRIIASKPGAVFP